MEATYSGSFVRKVRINKRPVYKIEKFEWRNPAFLFQKRPETAVDGYRLGACIFLFLFKD